MAGGVGFHFLVIKNCERTNKTGLNNNFDRRENDEDRFEKKFEFKQEGNCHQLVHFENQTVQSFLDVTRFINRVHFFAGIFQIELMPKERCGMTQEYVPRSSMRQLFISVFGQEVKRFKAKVSDIWDQLQYLLKKRCCCAL